MSPALIAIAGWVMGNVALALVFVGWFRWECRRGIPERWWPL